MLKQEINRSLIIDKEYRIQKRLKKRVKKQKKPGSKSFRATKAENHTSIQIFLLRHEVNAASSMLMAASDVLRIALIFPCVMGRTVSMKKRAEVIWPL